jgi:3-oxoacyl-[acyl-carrier-protein] synthase-3
MSVISRFGRYLPERVVGNDELAELLGCEAGWILQASGIEERCVAADGETVVDMAVAAAKACLGDRGGENIGTLIVSCGSAERRFPGPAAEVAHRLGLAGIPALDLPLASAGSLFAIALASRLAADSRDVLVVASEKMAHFDRDKNIAILFGDGAGACLVSPKGAGFRIVDSVLHSDGAWAGDLAQEWSGNLHMNGPTVIMQAARKVPAAIGELLARNTVGAEAIGAFVMHQANQNLMDRVARALRVPENRFFSNIRRYGNTSSASMLIAASELHDVMCAARTNAGAPPHGGDTICLAAFGAGFHWGAALCVFTEGRYGETQ